MKKKTSLGRSLKILLLALILTALVVLPFVAIYEYVGHMWALSAALGIWLASIKWTKGVKELYIKLFDWKVITVSNYDLETVSEQLVMDKLTRKAAKKLADQLNDHPNRDSAYWHKAVRSGHRLYRWNPNE